MKELESPYTRDKTEAFLHQVGIAECPLIYAVEDRQKNFVGYVIYHPYEANFYEIGWVLHKNQWGKGYASELTSHLIMDAKSKAKNLVIECAPSQTVTKRIAQRFHFSFAGCKDGLEVYTLRLHGDGS